MKRSALLLSLVVGWSGVAHAQAPSNDTCKSPIDFSCGDRFNLTIDTTLANNDYELPEDAFISCTGFNSAGPDIVFRIVIPDGGSILAGLDTSPPNGSGLDGSLYLITDCSDPVNSCLVGHDSCNALLETELIAYTNDTGASLTTYLIVDGFLAQAEGACGAPAGTGLLTGRVDCGAVPVQQSTWGQIKDTYEN